ncbi:MAG: hypothetical protein ACYCU7_16985 [Acidimicrobiales bacterium]
MEPDSLVALKDAAAEYSYLTERRLRYLVAEGFIPYCKVGRLIYLDRADLDALPVKVGAVVDFTGRHRLPGSPR